MSHPGILAFDSGLNSSNSALISQVLGVNVEPRKSSHRVYNFEVAETHTYIADGIRVHNQSVLSYLEPEELRTLTRVEDLDNDGDLDFAVSSIPGTATEIQTSLQYSNGETAGVIREVTTGDGKGNVVYSKTLEDINGQQTVLVEPMYLQGQFVGEAVGKSLTPFLTSAIIGPDGSPLEQIAVDTILGTVVENVGGVIGATIDRSVIDFGMFSLAENLESITDAVFEDFGSELVGNGITSTISVVNQLIMAEIFESVSFDGVTGAVFEALVGSGLDYILANGVDTLIESASGAHNAFDPAQFNVNPGVVVINAVVNEILPDLETLEGQIASSAASSAVTLLGNFKIYAAGPVAAVVGFLVGKVFDSLFDKDPQAYANVIFNSNTGLFQVGSAWEDDGGNIQAARATARSYVEFMNTFLIESRSTSNNLAEVADQLEIMFGHYEDQIYSGSARVFETFRQSLDSALIDTFELAELYDGDLKYDRIIDFVETQAEIRDIVYFDTGLLEADRYAYVDS